MGLNNSNLSFKLREDEWLLRLPVAVKTKIGCECCGLLIGTKSLSTGSEINQIVPFSRLFNWKCF